MTDNTHTTAITARAADGQSKDTIGTWLITEHGLTVNGALKAIKASGVKFTAQGSTEGWRQLIVDCFKANPAATVAELTTALEGSVKDAKKYAAYYHDMAADLVAITLPKA